MAGDPVLPSLPAISDAQLEDRAQALASFSAGVVEQSRDNQPAALEHFVRASEKDPANEALAVELARRFISREQPQKAAEILRRTVALPGASIQTRVMLGLACLQSGQLDEAVEVYRGLIRTDPGQIGHYAMLAQILIQQKLPAEAQKVVDAGARQRIEDPGVWLDLAALYGRVALADPALAAGAQPKVRACLAKVEAMKPTQPAVLLRLADGYLSLKDSEHAERILREVAAAGSPDPQVAARLADIYLRSGRLAEAGRQFQEMARANPSNPAPHYFLGIIALQQRDFAQAVTSLERSILLNPDFAAAYSDLATAFMSVEQYRQALEALGKARERFAPDFRREFLAALCHANLKEFELSQGAFKAAEKIARDTSPELLDHRFYLQVGSMLERAGRIEESVAALEHSLALQPDYDEALNHLGYMWAERGENLQLAKDMIERAVKAEPENPAYLDSLGWVLFQLKKPAEALPPLEKAVGLMKEPDATVLDHLGDVLNALGRTAEAKAAWQRSLSAEPNETVERKLNASP